MRTHLHAIEYKCGWIMTNYMFHWIIDKLMNLMFSWIILICYEFVFELMQLSMEISIELCLIFG